MKIIIDEREQSLYEKCDSIVHNQGNATYIQLSREVLILGDVLFQTDEGKNVLLIERKSLQDLLASIKDGRYEEQSYRLTHASGFHPHNILYMIEGIFSTLRSLIEKKTVYSAITSLNHFKGFSVLKTSSVSESAEMIIWMGNKIERDLLKGKTPFYLHPSEEINDEIEGGGTESSVVSPPQESTLTASNYCSVVKKVKKDNITPSNIGEIILCQIPGISSVTAIAIMKPFGTFAAFMEALVQRPELFENITYETGGKVRRINKKSMENIRQYLL